MVAEFFSKGNIILLDSGDKIVQPLHFQTWKHRSIKPKQQYVFPPESADTKELTAPEFSEILKSSDKDLVRTLATTFNFGGSYAEEICARAGVDKNSTQFSGSNLKKVYKTLKEIFETTGQTNYLYTKDDTPIDFSPVKLSAETDTSFQEFKTLSEACDLFFAEERAERVEAVKDKKVEQFENRLKQQEETLEKHMKDMNELKKAADQLSIDQKFDEAGKAYTKAKKLRKKIPGLRDAIETTKSKIEKAKALAPEEKLPEKKVKRKKAWYESFRWFRSSDNVLVIGGKDATTNEIIIKKHTEPKDIVFHADIQGAPFCVIKTEGKKVKGSTLQEAAEFAASYSKAWQRGFGTVDVYSIAPDQVKKELGLPKGSFMIHGKRRYFRGTGLKLAIGSDENEIISGPENAVKSQTGNYSLITPGSEKSAELAKKIKAKLNTEANLDEIQRVIPAGKGRLVSE